MPDTLRILVAPTSFKGTLSAPEAAEIIERSLCAAGERLGVAVEIDRCPIADGGEGTAALLASAIGAEVRRSIVAGPFPDAPAHAEWFRVERLADAPALTDALGLEPSDAPLALFDAAEIGGLPRVPPERRDPALVSTRGVGELIAVARDEGCAGVVIGLGGSASIDAGIGAASALGWTFLDGAGAELPALGASLSEIAHPGAPPKPPGLRIVALCDVTNALIGPEGAARVFGPQKGVTPEGVESLERGLAGLVKGCIMAGIPANPGAPGSGAAGGLGFGLRTFAGGELVPGAPAVLRALGVASRMALADLVVTGEGSLDAQTGHGKAIGALLGAARAASVPVVAIAGRAEPDAGAALGLRSVLTLVDGSTTLEEARRDARGLLAARAETLLESPGVHPGS